MEPAVNIGVGGGPWRSGTSSSWAWLCSRGNLVCTRVVPRDHFLVQLDQVIDWDAFTDIVLPAY